MPCEPIYVAPLAPKGALLAWAPRRGHLATVGAGGVIVVDADRGGAARCLGDHGDVHELAWSPDARTLAMTAETDFTGVRGISVEDGAPVWSHEQERERIDGLRWSPDGRWIACVMLGVAVIEAATGRVGLRVDEAIDEVHWSPTGRWLLLRARSWRRDPGELRVSAADGGITALSLRISDDDFVGWTDLGDELLRDGADRLGTRPTRIVDPYRRTLTYTRDGALAAAEGTEHVLWIERASGPRRIYGVPRTITAMTWSPCGDLATGCRDGGVRLVRADTEELQLHWRSPAGERVVALAWSADGAWLAVATDHHAYVLPV